MPSFDKSKISRPEILKIVEEREISRFENTKVYFKKSKTPIAVYKPIWKKITELNHRWLKGEDVEGTLTMEEMLLQVEFIRFYMEYPATKSQKEKPIPRDVLLDPIDANGVSAEWQTNLGVNVERILLYIHGGGHIMSSINTHREFTVSLGKVTNMRVLSLDYHRAPEYPHPAALDDCVSAYKWLLSIGINPKNIIISGDSAGGYYTLLTLLKLRDDRIPLPAGAICLSPSTDMAQTGESVKKNCYTDVILGDLGYIWWIEAHLAGKDPYDPAISPLYADLRSLPPILIQVSTSEMLFDDSKRFYQRAKKVGVNITLQTWDDTLHVFQNTDLPETKEAMEKIKKFTEKLF